MGRTFPFMWPSWTAASQSSDASVYCRHEGQCIILLTVLDIIQTDASEHCDLVLRDGREELLDSLDLVRDFCVSIDVTFNNIRFHTFILQANVEALVVFWELRLSLIDLAVFSRLEADQSVPRGHSAC